MREEIKLLWTGGYDSTYRIIELSFRDVTIRPIYVVDPDRRSVEYEFKAMNDILEMLKARDKTKAELLPVEVIQRSDIPENAEITQAYMFFKQEAQMGSQHDWLARLAAARYPMMELCIENALGDHAPIRQSIQRHGKLIDTGDGYIVDKENSSKELNLVLGNLKLPIFAKTEVEMLRDIREWGYEDVISHIWFCHSPINGKPCGFCNPCSTKMDADMAFLLPRGAQKRNTRMRSIEKRFGPEAKRYYRAISRRIAKLMDK